ncbi:MAG: response regulator, partial [Elusimicrobiota bacterium]
GREVDGETPATDGSIMNESESALCETRTGCLPPAPSLLVIDDERGIRDLLSFELSSRGFRVAVAADGEEGVRKATEQAFDLVVTDLAMPKLDGLGTLSAIKENDPRTEVILITGHATAETAVESMRRGAYDYLTKPFEMDDLCRLIDRALERRRMSVPEPA